MNIKQVLTITATSVGLSLFAPHAQAALITGVTVSSDMGVSNSSNIDNTVNGVGLPGNTPALTGTHAAGSPANIWAGNAGVFTGNIIFDLNGSFDLAGFSFWNFNRPGDISSTFGIQSVTVQSSTDGVNFSNIVGAPTVFAQANGGPQDPEQFSFSPVNASFVRFVVGSNYGGPFTGFAEAQFDGTPASPQTTPEPASLLGLMVLGGGLLASKRRQG